MSACIWYSLKELCIKNPYTLGAHSKTSKWIPEIRDSTEPTYVCMYSHVSGSHGVCSEKYIYDFIVVWNIIEYVSPNWNCCSISSCKIRILQDHCCMYSLLFTEIPVWLCVCVCFNMCCKDARVGLFCLICITHPFISKLRLTWTQALLLKKSIWKLRWQPSDDRWTAWHILCGYSVWRDNSHPVQAGSKWYKTASQYSQWHIVY